MTETPESFTFFWSGPFSHWYRSPFRLDGELYRTAESYLMAEKARLFGDDAARREILCTTHPRQQKEIGRRVRGFDEAVWRSHARAIAYRGNRAKFCAHPDLLDILLGTAGTTLVEASPNDAVWGIGLAAEDPRALNRATWLGTNWLGEVLTCLRDDLLAERAVRLLDKTPAA